MKQYKINFYENRKKFFMGSTLLIVIGIIFNVIFGTRLDMQFTGGAIIKYSYTGEISQADVEALVSEQTEKSAEIKLDTGDNNSLSITFSGTDSLPLDKQKKLTSAMLEKFPDNDLSLVESSSIDASMGKNFFYKCLICILIAVLILILYISIRFKRIGGMSAGISAIIALIHDVALVYFTFVVARIPLNDSFIAVVLTILGYSLNDTIVIYDRIRENESLADSDTPLYETLNLSINQTLSRSIYTSVSTFIAIAIVFVTGLIYNLHSITTFALPMMVGIVTGCYSSICIAGPLYVSWHKYKPKHTVSE